MIDIWVDPDQSVGERTVHEEFEAFLDMVAPKPGMLEKIGDLLAGEVDDYQAELAARNANRKNALGQLDREVQGLIAMHAQDLITDQEFIRQRKSIVDRRIAVEARAFRIPASI